MAAPKVSEKKKYPYEPDLSKGMVWEVYKMGTPHYFDWVMSTTLPQSQKLHYFDPNTAVGSFLNLSTKCPWQVVVVFWVPHLVFLLGAAIGLGNIFEGVPILYQHYLFMSYFLFLEPYGCNPGPALATTKFMWGYLVIGFLFFNLFEWVVHKYLFHKKPTSCMENSAHLILHGSHHLVPMDTMRLVFPPVPASVFYHSFGLMFYFLTPNVHVYYTVMAGVMIAYLTYDLMHYANHHANYDNRMLGIIKRHHLRHHFHTPNEEPCNYALSLPAMIWDEIFQTKCPKRNSKGM